MVIFHLLQMVNNVHLVMNMVDTFLDQQEYMYLHEFSLQFYTYCTLLFHHSSWKESYKEYHFPSTIVQYDLYQHGLTASKWRG